MSPECEHQERKTMKAQEISLRRESLRNIYAAPRSAFTLIELLVVVSIIALLISILLPSLKSARDQAKLLKCLANQKGMASAAYVFSTDRNGVFQLASNHIGTTVADPSGSVYAYDNVGELLSWPVALALGSGIDLEANWKWGVRAGTYAEAYEIRDRMSNQFQLTVCPSDPVKISTPFYPRDTGLIGQGDPDFPQSGGPNLAYWGFLSYGINEDIIGNELVNPDDGSWLPGCWKDGCRGELQSCAGERLRGMLERVYDPGTCILMIDAGPDSGEDQDESDLYANLITSAKAAGPRLIHAVYQFQERLPERRHPGSRYGAVFADLHGQSIKVTERYENPDGTPGTPSKFSGNPRVSPYRPWKTEN